MKTDELLRNTYKLIDNIEIPFNTEELVDRRRLQRRILKNSKFESCTDEQLDHMTVHQLPGGGYIVSDDNGCEWKI